MKYMIFFKVFCTSKYIKIISISYLFFISLYQNYIKKTFKNNINLIFYFKKITLKNNSGMKKQTLH